MEARALSGGALQAARALVGLACAGACAIAAAQGAGWQFSASIYGYFPSVSGGSALPADPDGTLIHVDSSIIDKIEGAGMAAFEARNGAWGFFVDAMYLHLGDTKHGTRDFSIGDIGVPAGTTADLDWDLRGQIWTFAGTYRIVSGPALTLDGLAGGRYADVRTSLAWGFSGNIGPIAPAGRSGKAEGGVHILDGIVGVKGRMVVSDNGRWSLPFYLDVGAGDSDLTWQGFAGVGYGFSWGELTAGWRTLQYRRKVPKAFEDFEFNGPMAGATFRW